MQDVFVENIVKKTKKPLIVLLQVFLIVFSVILALVLVIAGLFFAGQFISIVLLLAVGLVYGAILLSTSFNVEFETCLTNGSFDVDKIINRRRRKRLISLKCKDIETFGKYKAIDHASKNYQTRIVACDSEEGDNVWYLTLRHSSLGNTLVVVNLDDRLLEGFKEFLPRQLAFEVFNRR